MIERKAFLQITKALILGMRNSLTDPSACMKQNIIEELAAVLGVERCVIFKIGQEEVDGQSREFCEIAAGVPLEEYGPDFRDKSPLDAHPDIKGAVQNGRVLVIKDPLATSARPISGASSRKRTYRRSPTYRSSSKRTANRQGSSFSTRSTEGRSAKTRSSFARSGRASGPAPRAGKDHAPAFQGCDHQQGSASGRFCQETAGKLADHPRLHRDHPEGGDRNRLHPAKDVERTVEEGLSPVLLSSYGAKGLKTDSPHLPIETCQSKAAPLIRKDRPRTYRAFRRTTLCFPLRLLFGRFRIPAEGKGIIGLVEIGIPKCVFPESGLFFLGNWRKMVY